MKIIKKFLESSAETVLTIEGTREEVEKLELLFKNRDKLLCEDGNQKIQVRIQDILYIESLERKTYVYTNSECYTIQKKLIFFEEEYSFAFLRASKSILLNKDHVVKFKTSIHARIEAILSNNEKLMINRMYVKEVKKQLGGRI